VEKGGRKKYITERNRRSPREWQGIVPFCTCQWNEQINNPVKHSYFYHKNSSVFTKICYMFQPVSPSLDEAFTKIY